MLTNYKIRKFSWRLRNHKIPLHKSQISLSFHILQLVKSLPFHILKAWKRYTFHVWAEPPCRDLYREGVHVQQLKYKSQDFVVTLMLSASLQILCEESALMCVKEKIIFSYK